jgi:hypothetical protein
MPDESSAENRFLHAGQGAEIQMKNPDSALQVMYLT